ncbi:hypothetical protein FRC05_004792 [Tulasnella sp. 425]|nr:hypothetical protein FRC05_004792 [Tulasnella sp. 425]
MDLLPSSEAWPELGDHRFYLPDVQRVQREITNCRSKIAAQLPGAREQFEFYISRCKGLRAEIEQHACLCQKKYAYLMSVDFDEQQVGRDRLRGFLLDMGHRDKDVQMALHSGGIDLSLGLTKAANRGKIESLVQLKKATNVLAERRELAGLTYPELRRSSGVELHHFAPSLEDFLEWTLASNIINQDPDVVVTKQDFLDLKAHFMDFVETWRTSKSLIIRRSVIGSETGSVPEDPKGEELLRATSAFLCVLFPLSDKVCMLWADGSFLKHMSDNREIRDFERQKCLGRRRLDSQVAASLARKFPGRGVAASFITLNITYVEDFNAGNVWMQRKLNGAWIARPTNGHLNLTLVCTVIGFRRKSLLHHGELS